MLSTLIDVETALLTLEILDYDVTAFGKALSRPRPTAARPKPASRVHATFSTDINHSQYQHKKSAGYAPLLHPITGLANRLR